MLNRDQFRTLIVGPALRAIGLWGVAAEELVLGTALVESKLKYLKQLGGGPALGLYQVEPATHEDLWDNWLRYNPDHGDRLRALLMRGSTPAIDQLVCNLYYATAVCRLLYYRHKEPLAKPGDIAGHARYWKQYYNTYLGDGMDRDFIAAWELGK